METFRLWFFTNWLNLGTTRHASVLEQSALNRQLTSKSLNNPLALFLSLFWSSRALAGKRERAREKWFQTPFVLPFLPLFFFFGRSNMSERHLQGVDDTYAIL